MIGNPLLLGGGDYEISRSVRLRSNASAFFNRTPASAGNRKVFTWSGWVKRGQIGVGQTIFGASTTTGSRFSWEFLADNRLDIAFNDGAGWYEPTTVAVFRDPSAWYHIVVACDLSQATASNRVNVYINGVQQTLSGTFPPNADSYVNSTAEHRIGSYATVQLFDGYLTEINFIDGQALTPSSFGETDVLTGVWKPKKYAGTYGTNGFYLNFSDPSAATAAAIGKDYSGNGNNWTPNNISVTSGSTYDSMLDVPTLWADGGNGRGNYATLNPLATGGSGAASYSFANLRASGPGTANYRNIASTIHISSAGKWFWETTVTTHSTDSGVGLYDPNLSSYYLYLANGNKTNGTSTAYGASYTSGDVIGIAFDADLGTLTFYKNGVSQGQAYSGIAGTWQPSGYVYSTGVQDFNFGQRPFAYTPPSGFKALNTQNLPEPTIKKGNQYFDISTWTGDQSARTITNSGGMQPDFLWTKSRSAAEDHRLSDAVRGGNGTVLGTLASNTTGAEAFDTDVTGFTSSGFNIRAGTNSPNVTGRTYVGWQWKEGATQGFDIVTYTGDGTSPRNISHSLGVAPAMVIVKSRGSVSSWIVKHKNLSSNNVLFLEGTNAQLSPSNGYVQDLNNSSTFGVVNGGGGVANVNTNGTAYVAYLFAPVSGYSVFGSYSGNGSADGPFVFTGFRPRFIMLKNVTTSGNGAWVMFDTTRSPSNVQGLQWLFADSSGAESTANSFGYFDILSNGFKCRGSGGNINVNGENYIYACFAEHPFKLSLAR